MTPDQSALRAVFLGDCTYFCDLMTAAMGDYLSAVETVAFGDWKGRAAERATKEMSRQLGLAEAITTDAHGLRADVWARESSANLCPAVL